MKKLNKHITLLGLQIKAAYMALPKILVGMMVFAVLMFLAAYGLTSVEESKDGNQTKMIVGVVYPDTEESKEENRYIEQAFAMLGKLDVVKEACSFENYYDEKLALEGMKLNKLTAVIVLPENFISSIIYGKNTPARIVFPTSGVNTSSVIFREILAAAASDLSSAQAGIYAVDDAIHELGGDNSDIEKAEAYLNLKYIAYAINREALYEQVSASGGEGSTTVQFYVATGMLLLFLMGSITCIQLLKSESRVMGLSLKRYGVAPGTNHLFKVFGVTLVFWTVAGIAYTLVSLAVARFPAVANVVTALGYIKETVLNADGTKTLIIEYKELGFLNILTGVGALFILLFAVLSMAGLVFKIAGKTVSGVIMLFLVSVVMMFASGCFLPVSMLPPIVGDIGQWLPTTMMFDLCTQIITGMVNAVTVGLNLAYAIAFLVIAAIMENNV